jgi:DNA topoisomerase I
LEDGYTLVICEKPDAAKRVADALSSSQSAVMKVDGTTVYGVTWKGEEFRVCSAQGHAYVVSDPADERTVYPTFDVEWYPLNEVDADDSWSARRISAMAKLASGAKRFVNACDLDVEGETIGLNLLRYACGGKEREALRAKFSTLTDYDLKMAFENLVPQRSGGMAEAGRARHVIDFVWGVNFSRALSQSALGAGHRYTTVSMGRVQGPTLGFLAQREREIREFVPLPYWKVSGVFGKDGKDVVADCAEPKILTVSEGEGIRSDCLEKEAVAAVKRSVVDVGPPAPPNIGDLQREAYRAFGFFPSRTMQVAERLYLDALISYPRTESQRLPQSIGYGKIIQGVGRIQEYSSAAAEILKTEPRPVQGPKSDPAHPAIHPTGDRPKRQLGRAELELFDLIVRRFLAAFGPSARRELFSVSLTTGRHRFRADGSRTVFPGWMKYYGRYAGRRDVELPQIAEGDRLRVKEVLVEEKFEQRPPRYNQGSLLEKMEKEAIGTKSTRAEIITTLMGRGYASGAAMEVTDLGLSVAETMEKYSPSMLKTELTREVERKLEAVEKGGEESSALRDTIRLVAERLVELSRDEEAVGKTIGSALELSSGGSVVLGKCPVCKTGNLKVVRSRTTRKRFVGCSNYASGCRASAPLPQRGIVEATTSACRRCSWPMIVVKRGRAPWRVCVNPSCPERKR